MRQPRIAMLADRLTALLPEDGLTVSRHDAKARLMYDNRTIREREFEAAVALAAARRQITSAFCRLDRMVAHPMRPDLVGRPLMQITDNNGKVIFKELCKAGNDPRGGWVEYVWTKPGAGRAKSVEMRRLASPSGSTA